MFSSYNQAQLGDPGASKGGALHGGVLPGELRTAIADHSQVPPQSGVDEREMGYLREEFRASLLRAMGLDEAVYTLVARTDFVGEAVAAGKSLEQIKDTDSSLGPELRAREKQIREALHQAYRTLWTGQGGNEDRIAALNTAVGDIESVLPALMLAPRGPYERLLWQLIKELERAAGTDEGLDDRESALLHRLNGHAAAIAMVKRDSAEGWRKVGRLVFAWDDGSQDAHATNA